MTTTLAYNNLTVGDYATVSVSFDISDPYDDDASSSRRAYITTDISELSVTPGPSWGSDFYLSIMLFRKTCTYNEPRPTSYRDYEGSGSSNSSLGSSYTVRINTRTNVIGYRSNTLIATEDDHQYYFELGIAVYRWWESTQSSEVKSVYRWYQGDFYLLPYNTSGYVYYDANEGSGSLARQKKTIGTALTISTAPTRTNYTFWHWNTNQNNTGTTYEVGDSYTAETSATLYAIWNPIITFKANGGIGGPSTQTKTFGQDLTITTSKPTRAGYGFYGWNTKDDGTGTYYLSGGTYSSNSAATLYARWVEVPEISSIAVVRCDSSGTQDDQGTYCKVTAAWSVDTARHSGNTGTVTGTVKPQSGSAVAFSFSSGASGTGGTAVAIVSNVDVDTQYTVTVTVTDSLSSITSRSDILTRAKFVWDIRAGGLAMGIGSAAPQSGLEVGWAAQFDENVTLLRNLILNGTISGTQFDLVSATSDIVTAETGWAVSSQSAKVVGRVCMIQLAFKPSASVSANTSSTIGTIASDYRPLLRQGFADSSGTGYVSTGGSITFRNLTALTTSSTIYVALTYIK